MRNNLYQILAEDHRDQGPVCLATIITKTGSTPQVPGSSALISQQGLIEGTLGGGILEATAIKVAGQALEDGNSLFFEFDLNNDISDPGAGICGGRSGILIDTNPGVHREVFRQLVSSLQKNTPGTLITYINTVDGPSAVINKIWKGSGDPNPLPPPFNNLDNNQINRILRENKTMFIPGEQEKNHPGSITGFFLQPFFPLPRLIVAGAGHVGKALVKLAAQLDFHITLADDRPDTFMNSGIGGVAEIITGNYGHIMEHLSIDSDTYIVIVTSGHSTDSEVLKACIGSQAAYIGMIGSRRKTKLMREQFLEEGWATPGQWEEIHTPIGLDIGAKTVQEIAISIAAELVRERHRRQNERQCEKVWGLVLAAGESKRMGTPKMLLSFAESTIIETVIERISRSHVTNIMVVVGADKNAIIKKLKAHRVVTCINPDYQQGMYSSVRHGIHAIPADADAIMVFLGDQPMIKPALIDEMIETWKKTGKGIIIPVFQNKRGHPVLIDAKYRKDIDTLDPEKGLRSLMTNFPGDILELNTNYSSVLRDIDTALDYQREITGDQ